MQHFITFFLPIFVILLANLQYAHARVFDATLVRTTYGAVRGRTYATANGHAGLGFMNIPYASAPTGDRRFRPTVPLGESWDGIRDATDYGPACMSNSSFTRSPQYYISEDCLTMNIFTSRRCRMSRDCPVIYYIHGGGWEQDSPRVFPQETLIDNFARRDVIMVTFGYRLGLFGFWSAPITDDIADEVDLDDGRGNYGVYDMVEGLRWVRAEIRNFGGDPNRISLMGHSSGSMASHLVGVLPAAQGLFDQTICVITDSIFTVDLAAIAQESMNQVLADSQSCLPSEGAFDYANVSLVQRAELMACMRNMTGHDLLAAHRAFEDEENHNMFLGPTVDGQLIDRPLWQLVVEQKPHNLLIGQTNNENSGALPENPNADFHTQLHLLCVEASSMLGFDPLNKPLIEACAQFYANQTLPDIMRNIDTLVTDDERFTIPTFRAAMAARNAGSTVYLYEFDYSVDPELGTHHAQDLTYVMGLHLFNFTLKDEILSRSYSKYFADFATFGRPMENRNWRAFSKHFTNYYSINLISSNNYDGFHRESADFWTKVAPTVVAMFPSETPITKTITNSTLPAQPEPPNHLPKPKPKVHAFVEPIILDVLVPANATTAKGPSAATTKVAPATIKAVPAPTKRAPPTTTPTPTTTMGNGLLTIHLQEDFPTWTIILFVMVTLALMACLVLYARTRIQLIPRAPVVAVGSTEKQPLLDSAQEGYQEL